MYPQRVTHTLHQLTGAFHVTHHAQLAQSLNHSAKHGSSASPRASP
jgi:hypothetical protein